MPCPALVIPRFVVGKCRPAALGLLIGFHFIQLDFPFHLRKGNRHAPVVLVGIDRIHLVDCGQNRGAKTALKSGCGLDARCNAEC